MVALHQNIISKRYYSIPEVVFEVNKILKLEGKLVLSEQRFRQHSTHTVKFIKKSGVKKVSIEILNDTILPFYILNKHFGVKIDYIKQILTIINIKELHEYRKQHNLYLS